jgi:prepilin-type N-terminal cleavage/methylation domain-containing protein
MKRFRSFSSSSANRGFTLFELLASLAILAVLSALLFAAFNQASNVWLQSENRVETFTQARAALEFMSRELSQAIVTTNVVPYPVPFAANTNTLAFVAPVNPAANGVDLMEIVYQLSGANPPYALTRAATAFSPSTTYWDFYTNPNGWPGTSDPNGTNTLAVNVMNLQFRFFSTNMVSPPSPYYWNSTLNPVKWFNGLQHITIPPGAQPDMMGRAPAGALITLGVIDNRAAARLNTVTLWSPAWTNMANTATRTFQTFVAIRNGL